MEKLNLKEEGITKEFLNSIDISKGCSPAQLKPGEEPVKLLECSSGYWVSLGFGEFLKDETGTMVVISKKEAKIGRARYLLNFKDEVYQKEIAIEIERLKKQVDEKLKHLLPQMKTVLVKAGVIEVEGLEKAIMEIRKPDEKELEFYKTIATESFANSYNKLVELKEAGDYDSLYMLLFQDGVPLMASFQNNEIDQLAKFFHKDKLEDTISKISGKSHLENVAMFNLEKRASKPRS
jgi:hypothetical protein